MPDRATMEAARPKCPAAIDVAGVAINDTPAGRALEIDVSRNGAHRCAEPMTFDDGADCWICPRHGPIPRALLMDAQAWLHRLQEERDAEVVDDA